MAEQLSKFKSNDPVVIFIHTIQHCGEVVSCVPTICGNFLYTIRTESYKGELISVKDVPENKVYSHKPDLKYRLSSLDENLEPIILEESFVKSWLAQLAKTLETAKVTAIDVEDNVVETITFKNGVVIDHVINFSHA